MYFGVNLGFVRCLGLSCVIGRFSGFSGGFGLECGCFSICGIWDLGFWIWVGDWLGVLGF